MPLRIKNPISILFYFILLGVITFSVAACGDGEESVDSAKAADLPTTATSSSPPTAEPVSASAAITPTEEASTQTPTATPDPNVIVFDVAIHDGYYGDKDSNMIDPPIWYVEPDKVILINATNDGTEKHNWVIVKQGAKISSTFDPVRDAEIVFYDPGMVYAKSETTLTLMSPPVGSYAIICTVSGHYPYMQGRLVVSN